MYLHPTNLAHYLLTRGLVETEELVRGPFSIEPAGRRNRNFKVRLGDERPGLFVKQVPTVATETVASVFREAACCQLAASHPGFRALKRLAPRLVDYNPANHCVVLELLPDSEGFTQRHLRCGDFPTQPAAEVGRALAEIHGTARAVLSSPADTAAFPRMKPWVLSIVQNAESVFGNMTAAMKEVVWGLRQNQVLSAALAQLEADWRYSALIHGDVKWDNFLLRANEDGSDTLFVVDWELADVGDPAWDVACVFASYLQHWLATLSADASQADTAALILAGPHELDSTWPALERFWETYRQGMELTDVGARDELNRALRFTAARLVLTAFEIGFQLQQAGRTIALSLQLATAIAADPDRARRELLGFAEPGGSDPSPARARREPAEENPS